jgi:hypothetical protein
MNVDTCRKLGWFQSSFGDETQTSGSEWPDKATIIYQKWAGGSPEYSVGSEYCKASVLRKKVLSKEKPARLSHNALSAISGSPLIFADCLVLS